MLKKTFLVFVLCCGNKLCFGEDDLPEVETPLGKVQGFWKTTLKGRRHAAFEGIPYAVPPVGDLRFENPLPVKPWADTLKADKPQSCPQVDLLNPGEPFGDEDCLYLNVYTPVDLKNIGKKLDVIVVIHGGAFVVGSGHMMAESNFILDKDVVLVSINYRLGIFGFLSTEDNVIPGNFGLKDQVLALKWVKDNIQAFGGNPNSVTIVGLSAGGASVHLHYLSPLSKGLFNKGLSQSGTALSPWAIKENPLENSKKLAVLVGCPDSPSEKLKHCLKQQLPHNLMSQLKHFYGFGPVPLTPFSPVVEKGSDHPFLDQQPYWLMKEGKILDVPWVTSTAADDGLLPGAFYWEQFEEINKKWADVAHYCLDYNYTLPESKRASVAKEIFDYYLGPGENLNAKNYERFIRMFTDRLFAVPGELSARMQAKVNKSPVYYYIFNYKEGENKAVNLYSKSSEITGAAHGEDGIYFYGFLTAKPFSEQDMNLKDQCIAVLYSYASTGKPSFDGTDDWKPTGSSELTYLNVSGPNNFKLETTENFASIEFWNKLELLENENIIVKAEL